MSSLNAQSDACTLAALILQDSEKEFSSANIASLTKAAGVDVLPVVAETFAKFVNKESLSEMLERLTKVGAAPAGGASGAAPAAAAAAEPEPEEESSSSDAGFGGLF